MSIATLSRVRPESCLSDLQLDRALRGELARAEVDGHLSACTACLARQGELAEAERLLAPEMTRAAARLAAAIAPRPLHRRRAVVAGGVLLAAAAALLLLLRPRGDQRAAGLRAKGGLSLELAVRHRQDGRVEEVLPGEQLAAGDAIRFRVASPAGGQLVIVGLDAAGQVNAYVPPTAIAAGGGDWLDGAIELDDSRGAERIVAVLCPKSTGADEVVAAGRRALALAAGDPVAVTALGLPGCQEATTWFAKQ